MAELNHNTIKAAIVALLKTNSSLFTTTGEVDELRKITVGKPTDILQDDMFPYAIVTNGSPVDTIEDENFALADVAQLLEHTLRYRIILVVNKKDSRAAEALLDDLEELVLETLEGDRDISGNVDSHEVKTSNDNNSLVEPTDGKRTRIIDIVCTKTTGV